MINYLNNVLKKFCIYDYKIIKTTEKKVIFKDLFHVLNAETYTYTNIFIILHCDNGDVLKLNIVDKDSLPKILNFYNIKEKDSTAYPEVLDPVIIESPAVSKYNRFSYENCNNWIKRQTESIIKNNSLSFNLVMTGSLYEQELCDGNIYYRQYSENSNFIFAENTSFKQVFKLEGCIFDEELSPKISSLILKDRGICNKSINLNDKLVLFSQKAMATILNSCASIFYADRVYLGNSIISIKDLNKKFFSNFDLIFDSFESIKFDAEGSIVNEKSVIKKGILSDLLSNNFYFNRLNLKMAGNNSIYAQGIIEHQRIKIEISSNSFVSDKNNLSLTVKDVTFDKFLSKTGELYVSIYYQEANNETIYKSNVCINAIKFFEGILSSDKNYSWNNNVFCADTLIKL